MLYRNLLCIERLDIRLQLANFNRNRVDFSKVKIQGKSVYLSNRTLTFQGMYLWKFKVSTRCERSLTDEFIYFAFSFYFI